ncbi:class I SAM-dependent methyltransferase [Psychrobacillus vulpis]|uniref:Class I SAM-dependent methyltransferase n=1 Tax=Psychrobacillus vulpis TaxID=2325572 RepID=A0A544TNG6_9BACI|nr:class I SAM-dependent methyltransferase [Psychrobacillus vulpis]TQR18974.1 class I SAM-dependent methyltransferase [Psychrobacillus vulpis]
MEFDAEVSKQYDRGIRRSLPTYDAMFRMIQAFLRANVSEVADVLIVGAGGGTELTTFGTRNQNWTFTGVDPSETMLSVAQEKCLEAGISERVFLHEGTIDTLPNENLYDAATCILVLHFIETYVGKLEVLKNIHGRLKPGAPFVMVSKYGDPNSDEFQERLNLWKNYWLDTTKLTSEEVNEMEESILSLSFLPEETIVQLLQEAGFVRIAKFFSTTLFGGWICHKE